MSVLERNNVKVSGVPGGRTVVFAHGFGCDQVMWRYVAPEFEHDHQVVLFDHVGSGASDSNSYDPEKYNALDAYAADVIEILEALDVSDVLFVGHSVSSMIGILASIAAPDRIAALALVGPSPRYIDDAEYVGGFSRADIDELLTSLDSNYLGWSRTMAPVIMDNPERPGLAEELTTSFCRVDPAIARQFARVTFTGDNRDDLARVSVPTLVVQCTDDAIAPMPVGTYVHEQISGSQLAVLDVSGHCPNLSAPAETAAAIRNFANTLGRAA